MKEVLLIKYTVEDKDLQSDKYNNLSYFIVGIEFNYNNDLCRIDKVNLEQNEIKVYKFEDNEYYIFNNLNEINSLIEYCFNN